MAFVDTASHIPGKALLETVTSVLLAPFRAIEGAQDAARKGQKVYELIQLSDAELAERGLTREGIVSHVFGAPRTA